MSQKLSGAIAATIIATLWFTFAAFALERPGFEILGFALAPSLWGLFLGCLGGFIGGAIKKGSFKPVFFWTYIFSVIGACVLHIWGTYEYLFFGIA